MHPGAGALPRFGVGVETNGLSEMHPGAGALPRFGVGVETDGLSEMYAGAGALPKPAHAAAGRRIAGCASYAREVG